MIISLNWLKEYADIPVSPEQLAEDLTQLGLEIEKMENLGEEIQEVYIGKILAIEPHPDADKIVVCQTDVGGDAPLQICCGAKNMKVGDKVPTAIVGATLPGGFAIGRRKMRGVESRGMMCSPRELGLGDDHDGLMILPEDTPVGADAKEILGLNDIVYEIEVTPNRGDWASMIGVARELAAKYGVPLKMPAPALEEVGETAASRSSVTVEAPELCPLYLGRVLDDIHVGPSPEWLQKRLLAAGQRPINNIVDITNFVLLETGQPLHAFDYDKLEEHRIVVRRAKAGEKMTTLDEVERALDDDMLVIADAATPQCLAGIMGGATSEVSETTKRVFLESAWFEPRSIRKTSRQLGLISESSQRFQRGADPEMVYFALDRAAALMQEVAGATVCNGVIETSAGPMEARKVTLRFEKTNALLGTTIAPESQRKYLEALGFNILNADEKGLQVEVPLRRHDVSLEADLIEDIARLHGYSQLPAALPRVRPTQAVVAPEEQRIVALRRYLAGIGLTEMSNWTFSNEDEIAGAGLGEEYQAVVRLQNPLSEKYTVMRNSLIPGALRVAAHNLNRGQKELALFEVGPVFWPVEHEELPKEEQELVLVFAGQPGGKHWSGEERTVDIYDLMGYVERVGEFFGVELRFQAGDIGSFQAGECGSIAYGEKIIGHCGKVNRKVAQSADIDASLYIATLSVQYLVASAKKVAEFQPIPTFPVSTRDMALVVDRKAPAGPLAESARKAGGKLLKDVAIFDIYTGEHVATDKKSVALSLSFQAEDRTLTDKDTQKAWDKILRTLEREHGATLR